MFKCVIFVSLLIGTFSVVKSFHLQQAPGCSFDVMTNYLNLPIIWNNKFEFPLPNSQNAINFDLGETFYIACPGTFSDTGLNKTGELVKCKPSADGSTNIYVERLSRSLNFNSTTCTVPEGYSPTITRRATERSQCTHAYGLGYTIYGTFTPEYEICIDTTNLRTVYSKVKITSSAQKGKGRGWRPSWTWDSSVFNFNVNQAYTDTNIRDVFNNSGLSAYIDKGLNFINRGHLTAYADFFYLFQRDATYGLENVAPQWAKFNAGNWALLENAVVSKTATDGNGTVLTGTLGVAYLLNSTGQNVNLYLHNNNQIPVPKWFWKSVHYPNTGKKAIFFGYNNPHHQKKIVDADFLKEACSKDEFATISVDFNLQTMQNDNTTRGLMYACNFNYIQDATIKKIVTDLSKEFNVKSSFPAENGEFSSRYKTKTNNIQSSEKIPKRMPYMYRHPRQ